MLSPHELSIVADQEWILTKHQILEKISKILGSLSKDIQQHISDHSSFSRELSRGLPRISKGENYRQLPYLMLDYPALFGKEDVFALRTFFWWGNFFSINLHLSGAMKENVLPILKSNFNWLQQNNYYLGIHTDPWEHHFGADNYRLFKNYSAAEFEEIFLQKDFLKISISISLNQWESIPAFLEHHFTALMELLKN